MSFTLPGLPSDLLTSDRFDDRRLKVAGPVTVERGPNLDAFGRLRVSQPTAIWYNTLQYDSSPLLWSEQIAGNATSEHSYEDSGMVMSVLGEGDKVTRTVRQPIRYQPGKSRLDVLTWGLPNIGEGVRFRAGAFTSQDGIFCQIHDGAFSFGVRSSVSGAVVDTLIPQADWNIDRLDGTGPSGIALNPAAGHILLTDLQWLSLGVIRFGFELDGELFYAHQTSTANVITRPYMQTANLPIRYEIESFGGAGSVVAICSASVSEGGNAAEQGINFSASAPRTGKDVAATDAWTPLVSIRRANLFKGRPYYSAQITPTKFATFATGQTLQFGVFYRPTLTGPTWAAVNAESGVEFDTAATAMTGGILSDAFYVAAGGQGGGAFSTATGADTVWLLPLASDTEGGDQDIVTIAARGITGAGTGYAAIDYREVR